MSEKRDTYQEVTDKILEDLERGVRPWKQPWKGGVGRPRRSTGEPYKGINVILLWRSAFKAGYSEPIWMTFKQAKDLGGFVRKGERSTLICYANTIKKEVEDEEGNKAEKVFGFMKHYPVFNAEQIEGLPGNYYRENELESPLTESDRDRHCEEFFANTGSDVRHGGVRAYYDPEDDHIGMPDLERFSDTAGYYSTLAHEHIHWTKAESRLNRDMGKKRWGDAGYAMEELVAEMGAAFLSSDLKVEQEIREDHAAYIDSWIQVLKRDKRAIFTASRKAAEAADYLHALQPARIAP